MCPQCDINGNNFSWLEGLWKSVARNKLPLRIIDICLWHRLLLTKLSHKKKNHLDCARSHFKTKSCSSTCECFGWAVPSLCALVHSGWKTPVNSLGKHGCQSIASHTLRNHSPNILSATRSPEKASGSVCVRKSERKSTATMIYPHIQYLSLANFSHLRSPHKFDSDGASC